MGAGEPRDLQAAGRELDGIHFAMEFLSEQNRIISGEIVRQDRQISAKGKNVVVIGGGDTGSDCVGTANRNGAKSVVQLEILPRPADERPRHTPWPMWPAIMRTSSSHQEGCERRWSVMTKKLAGKKGAVKELTAVEVEWSKDDSGKWIMTEKADSEFTLKADLVLLAMGFVHLAHGGLVEKLGLELDSRGNIKVDNWQSSRRGVFAAGDSASGASLVVRAIEGGRKAAAAIEEYLDYSN